VCLALFAPDIIVFDIFLGLVVLTLDFSSLFWALISGCLRKGDALSQHLRLCFVVLNLKNNLLSVTLKKMLSACKRDCKKLVSAVTSVMHSAMGQLNIHFSYPVVVYCL